MGRLTPSRVWARASINPSENPKKVLAAIQNMLPDCDVQVRDRIAEALSDDVAVLDTIRESVASRQLQRVLRRSLSNNIQNNSTRFLLNKQAACMGIAAICNEPDESPLGPIEVGVESSRIDDFVQWMTGRPNG